MEWQIQYSSWDQDIKQQYLIQKWKYSWEYFFPDFLQDHNIRDYDDQIYVNDEDFFETFFDNDPVGLVHKIVFGSFNYYDPYVYFDAYNNLATIKDLKEFFKDHYDIHDVADCISENPEYFDFLNL